MKKRLLLQLLVGLVVVMVGVVPISHAQDDPAVVYAVLFYSPTCPHCHQFITEDLPPIQERFGEQLQVLFIDVTQAEGSALFQAVIDTLNVPEDRAGFVPTMVIGTTVMVGGTDIPSNMPTLVSDGLAVGGIGLPPVPELQAAYQSALASPTGNSGESTIRSVAVKDPTWQDRFKDDPVGNGLALLVLGLLVVGLLMQLGGEVQTLRHHKPTLWQVARTRKLITFGLAMLSAGMVLTLVFEDEKFSLPSLLALLVGVGLVGVAWRIWKTEPFPHQTEQLTQRLIPVLVVLGMLVAGYLAYIEIRDDAAVCGAVGDCNSVQQSDYARLFGVLPIGVLGLLGYTAILAAWWLWQRPNLKMKQAAQLGGVALPLIGVAFSVYLTFLEPFVIGATCAWCLTSALLMLLILWLEAPQGWPALNDVVRHRPPTKRM